MDALSDRRIIALFQMLAVEYKKFERIYARTLRVTNNVLPSQPNNEIRNFSGHVVDAANAPDFETASLEIVRARRHLRLATYDALEIMLLYRDSYTSLFVHNVERITGRKDLLQKRLNELTDIRRKAPTLEGERRNETSLVDDDVAVAEVEIEKARVASNYLVGAIKKYNYFARELEAEFGSVIPADAITPADLADLMRQSEIPVSRHKTIATVWTFAGFVCAVLVAAEFIVLRSVSLIWPIVAICGSVALFGTYLAMTEPQKHKRQRHA